ncbi:hypothetical protein DM02DRAFT_630684 [Periconia macrospinosa]|uniref:Zn(2)-C6 fungal-type domain-containing protein n=1 Tax=Periconia macrospinosa TaxID=97972 RepID=A0A2V1DJ69_9PLEO|nr:hypothetical protein DM02DRAFT_630684 [Periconia macrospinosa]
MSGGYRKLLPATALHKRAEPEIRKRQRISGACNACRTRKSRCNGERPKCKVCIERNSACHYEPTAHQTIEKKYTALESRKTQYEQLFDLMKSVSEREAQEILSRFRSGISVETLLSQVAAGSLLLQLSVVPETRFRYEFPYINKIPEYLFTDTNPYLQSRIYEPGVLHPPTQSATDVGHSNASSDTNQSPKFQGTNLAAYDNLYLKPFHAAEVIEPRLSNVKFSVWTSVCRDEALMRDLLKAWLRCEYLFTAAIQKDLFLEDMAAGRKDFCSSLLVNIVLGYACVKIQVCNPRFTNRVEYWNPDTLLYRFLAEAKRLWELEADKPRVTTVQAGIVFNVVYNLCGLDKVGQAYRIQAISLAKELSLFKNDVEGRSPRIRRGMAFTAWALFNWDTLTGFSFMYTPLLTQKPEWDLPDPLKEPDWYGEIWLKYPLGDQLVPMHFGQVIHAKSKFRVIMNDVCQAAYMKDSTITLSKANAFLSILEDWYNNLPEALLPKFIVLPGHLQLHMYYQHILLTIFEPLIDEETSQTPSPQQIVTDAKKRLQTLVRLYYLRHGFEATDLYLVIPLIIEASQCMDAIENVDEHMPAHKLEALRSTLILVAKGLHSQRRNLYLAEALFRVVRGRMRPAEVALFRGLLNVDERIADEKPDMAQEIRSHWPVSIVKKKEDINVLMLNNLLENYAGLNLEGEGRVEGEVDEKVS